MTPEDKRKKKASAILMTVAVWVLFPFFEGLLGCAIAAGASVLIWLNYKYGREKQVTNKNVTQTFGDVHTDGGDFAGDSMQKGDD